MALIQIKTACRTAVVCRRSALITRKSDLLAQRVAAASFPSRRQSRPPAAWS